MDGNLKRGKLLHTGIALTLVFGLSMATDAWAANAKRGIAAGNSSSSLTGGPDTFGYYFVDQDELILNFNFLDISGSGTPTVSGNEAGAPVTLGAGFSFYGTTYNQLVMSTNGYLSTDPADTGFDNSNDCPIPTPPNVGSGGRMYPVHDDLVVSQGYTQYFASPCPRTNELAIDGAAEDCTVFQWDDTNHFGSTATFQFDAQTILYHASGVILHQIQNDLATGASSTTGIQDPAGTVGLQYSNCNTAGTLNLNAAIAFYTCGTITVAPAPPLPTGTVGQPYSVTFTATGGTLPYTWSVTGTLPPGLTFTAGTLSGTPTTAGSYNFTVTATDAKGCAASQAYTVAIEPDPGCALAITPSVLPSGTVNTPYSATVTASGGTAPYTYTVSAGTLPAGLTLDSATGVISGTPTAAVEAIVTITATDANQCSSDMQYCIVILPAFNIFAGHGLGFGPGNTNRVEIFDASGVTTGVTWEAYGSAAWGTNVASGNMRQDVPETAELLTGPGPGDIYGPHVRGWDRTGAQIPRINFFAYGTLRYGVNVAAGNVESNNEACTALAEILTGAGPGAVFGPHVRGWNYDGNPLQAIQKINFFAYGTLKWGVNVDEGDTDGDNYAEIITGAGPGQIFATTVKGWNFDGGTLAPINGINFNAFTPLAWGVNVSGGDVDGDGFHEIVAARGPDVGLANEFAGFNVDGSPASSLPGYQVTVFSTMYGGRVGLGDLDGDQDWELLAGEGRDPSAPGGNMASISYDSGTSTLSENYRVNLFPPTNFGVNVAGAQLGY